MDFLPYWPDQRFARLPWLTALVVAACLAIYAEQDQNDIAVEEATAAFCEARQPMLFRMALKRITGHADAEACAEVMLEMHFANDRAATLHDLLADTRPLTGLDAETSHARLAEELTAGYRRFASLAPPSLTAELWYWPSSWDPWRMVTSSFAHADWDHVIFNMVFFVAFGAAVEVAVGPLAFAGMVIGTSLFSGVFYSIFSLGLGMDVPSLGFSDVVMAMIALLAFLAPHGYLNCALGWIPFVLRIPLPAWLLATWYAGWDVWTLFTAGEPGGVNLVAHVSGAAFGYLAGVIFLRGQQEALELG